MKNAQGNNSKSIKNPTVQPQWAELIKVKRLELQETQAEFGVRFGVSDAAVSYWESGTYDPPANVTWWLIHESVDYGQVS